MPFDVELMEQYKRIDTIPFSAQTDIAVPRILTRDSKSIAKIVHPIPVAGACFRMAQVEITNLIKCDGFVEHNQINPSF